MSRPTPLAAWRPPESRRQSGRVSGVLAEGRARRRVERLQDGQRLGVLGAHRLRRGPLSTRVEVEDTTKVSTSSAMVTTTRMIQPQQASPVAVAAGLTFSTVSVKAAIQAQ